MPVIKNYTEEYNNYKPENRNSTITTEERRGNHFTRGCHKFQVVVSEILRLIIVRLKCSVVDVLLQYTQTRLLGSAYTYMYMHIIYRRHTVDSTSNQWELLLEFMIDRRSILITEFNDPTD